MESRKEGKPLPEREKNISSFFSLTMPSPLLKPLKLFRALKQQADLFIYWPHWPVAVDQTFSTLWKKVMVFRSQKNVHRGTTPASYWWAEGLINYSGSRQVLIAALNKDSADKVCLNCVKHHCWYWTHAGVLRSTHNFTLCSVCSKWEKKKILFKKHTYVQQCDEQKKMRRTKVQINCGWWQKSSRKILERKKYYIQKKKGFYLFFGKCN